jgi:hypothetical protein
MNAHQTRLFLCAQAELVRVEGMKAENARFAVLGETPVYREDAFLSSAAEIDRLAMEIVNS